MYNSKSQCRRSRLIKNAGGIFVIMPEKQPGHGGKREGAGRKPTGQPRLVAKTVTLPQEVIDRLEHLGDGNLSAGIRKADELLGEVSRQQ